MKKIKWFGKRHILVELAVIYIAIVGGLFVGQRGMIYVPDRSHTAPAENNVGDMSVIHVPTKDDLTLEGWYKPPADPVKPVLIFFHGNAGNLRYRGGHVATPVLIMHGQRDRVVPFRFGRKLYDAAKEPKEFADYLEGGHCDLFNFGAATRILSFLEKHSKGAALQKSLSIGPMKF